MSDPRPACDLQLVVEIVHRAGLVCELDERQNAHPLIRARPRASNSTAWTAHAGLCSADPRAGAFVGPADSPQPRLLREPDERQIAGLVIAQALHRDPSTVVSYDEVRALGLHRAVLCTS